MLTEVNQAFTFTILYTHAFDVWNTQKLRQIIQQAGTTSQITKQVLQQKRTKNWMTKLVKLQCTIGRGGGGQNKWVSGCKLLTLKYMCQNTCLFEKGPVRKHTEHFFKARSQFFFEISNCFLIHHKRCHSKLIFFVKKSS